MKKLLFFLFTLVVLASGCGKKNTFTLEGSIKGLPSDTILVFYQEPDYKLDTILLSKGKFTYTITPDTFTIFSLLLGEKQILPIYADKGESVTLNGMVGEIEVKGKGENAQLAKHIQYLNTLENNKTAVMAAVDSLIKTNPHSYILRDDPLVRTYKYIGRNPGYALLFDNGIVPAFEIANLFPLCGVSLNDFLHPFLFVQVKGEADNNKLIFFQCLLYGY